MAGSKHNGKGHGRDDRHVTETPDVSHIKNVDVTHEASDVDISGILKFVMGLTVLGAVVFVLMWGMFRLMNAQAEREPGPGPMAMTEEERLPPPPRLQAARGFGVQLENGEWVNLEIKEPEAEYRVLRDQWERRLYCKRDDLPPGTIDDRRYCLPIDQAIDMLFTGGGLPTRAPASNSGKLADTAAPSAWSSGRVSGKDNDSKRQKAKGSKQKSKIGRTVRQQSCSFASESFHPAAHCSLLTSHCFCSVQSNAGKLPALQFATL